MRNCLCAALASFVLLLPSRALAQETIVGGMTWMTFFPSTWNAGAPKIVSDGLFYYAVFCGPGGSFTCTVARKRGDGSEPWTMSTRSFFSSQPPTMIIDRKGRLNFFYNDYQLKHVRIDHPSVGLDQWTQVATGFVPQVAYLHASYNAVSDEILVTFNETSLWAVYVGSRVGDAPWTYTVVAEAPLGMVDTYFRTVSAPGKYAILASEHVKAAANYVYTSAVLFEATSASGPWIRRELHRVVGDNLGIPYQNWVLANDLQMDPSGRLRALLHITELASGHANPLDGMYLLREEDNYVPRFIATPIEDGWVLYVDPSGVHIAFVRDTVQSPPPVAGVAWFRSDDSGVTWQRQPNGYLHATNPVLVDMRSGSMLGPYLHVMTSDWTPATAAFDHLSFGRIDLSVANTLDRYAYEFVDGDGSVDYTRGFRDASSGRSYSYVYDRHPDGSFSWNYAYAAGAYSQTYTAASDGSYRYTNSDGADISEGPLTLATVTPNIVPLGAAAALVIEGANFKPGAVVRVNGAARPTTRVSSVYLTARLLSSDAAVTGDMKSITVLNPDGAISSAIGITIAASPATLTPVTAATSPGATATFVVSNGPANQFDWVGWYCPATNGDRGYNDWKYLTNSTAAPVSGQAGGTITFTAPAVGGATCVARFFADNGYIRLATSATVSVINPVPAVTSLLPNSVIVGTTGTVSVIGSNFVPTSGVTVDGAARATTFVSSNRLNVALIAGDVATAGANPSVAVVNAAPGGGTSNAATLTISPSPIVTGPNSSAAGAVVMSVNNGPGNRTDWVGWYCPQTDDHHGYLDWKYLNDSRTAPATGLTSATVSFAMPGGGGGTCEARLFVDNGFTTVATSNAVAQSADASSFRLTIAPTAAPPRSTLTINAVNGGAVPTSNRDWIGLFCPSTTGDTAYVDWKYMNDSKAAPVSGWTSDTSVTMTAPSTLGVKCDARLFSDNGFSLIMTSWPVTVKEMPVRLAVASTVAVTGGAISVTVANGPANTRDWVGLYCPAGSGDLGFSDWKYLSGSRTPPAAGTTAATVTFTAPGTTATCNLRFFADDGFIRLATSANVAVQ